MKCFCLPFCLLLIAVSCLPGYCAIPSFRGYTGLIVVPTADALGKGDWNVGLFYENVSNETINDIVANYGITQGFEFGIDRFRLQSQSDNHTLLNAKYRFIPETMDRPAIAAGVADITDEIQTTVYVVASKSFGCKVRMWQGETLSPRVHVGFGGGRLSGLFAGASAFIGNRVEFLAEWDSQDVNAGMRIRFTPQFTVHVGGLNLTDQTDPFSTGPSFGVGASFNVVY